MKLHHLLFVIGIITTGTAQARAEAHDGWAAGPRAESSFYGAGADYWRGRLGVVTAVGGSAARERMSLPGEPTSESRSTTLGGSLGGLVAILDEPRARVAVGARVAYTHQRWHFGDD